MQEFDKNRVSALLKDWFGRQSEYATRKAAANAAGIAESSFRDYLRGRRMPSRSARQRLVELTGMELVGGERAPLFRTIEVEQSQPREREMEESESKNMPAKDPESEGRPLKVAPTRAEAPYHAYMATALTHLERAAKMGVIFISDCVATVCRKHGIELYEPRKATDPVHNATIQDHQVYLLDREKVTLSDLVIVLCEHPSFGAGQEIEIAGSATVPLLLLAMADKPPSRMVTGTPVYKRVVTFSDPDDLQEGLDKALREIRPHLQARRDKMMATPIPRDLGQRIRELRKGQRLDQEELAAEVGVSERFIRNLEESATVVTNLSLVQLGALARTLRVPLYSLFGEADSKGNAIPKDHIEWARNRGLGIDRLRDVLDFAARTSPQGGGSDVTPDDLELMLQRLESYEAELDQ